MTRRRLLTLLSGMVVLGAFSVYRLREGAPPSPPEGPPALVGGAAQVSRDPRSLSERDGVVSFHGETMGTTFTVRFVPPVAGVQDLVPVAVRSALADVNATMSTYDPKSELSLLNGADQGEVVRVSESLLSVLDLSRRITDQTGGAFDVTVGPLVRAFGFGAGAQPQGPSDDELTRIRASVGMGHVHLDLQARTVEKDVAGVRIDLSAVAKGYGVDRVAAELEKLSVTSYLVEVGGEIRVRGEKPGGEQWVLAIEHPDPNARRLYAKLTLPPSAPSLATSGDYRNFRKVEGNWISHTIDPRSGRPVPRRTASVSVVRPTAAEADALATGLGVLEPTSALLLAEQHDWAVMLLVRKSESELERLTSSAFDALSPEYLAGSGADSPPVLP